LQICWQFFAGDGARLWEHHFTHEKDEISSNDDDDDDDGGKDGSTPKRSKASKVIDLRNS